MKSLTKQQKLSLTGLSLLTILIFVIAIFQFRANIYQPFKKITGEKGNKEKIADLFNLKNIDTDKDGLNDFDEIYLYKTSPYLEDTDGDSILDKKERDEGTDPLCPKGSACESISQNKIASGEEKISGAGEELSLDEIRSFLIKSGADEEMLSKIDDNVLKEVYNETIKETGINPKDFSLEGKSVSDNSKNNPASGLENLSAQEIRDLLTDNGAGKEILNQIDDENLKIIFNQFLKSKESEK